MVEHIGNVTLESPEVDWISDKDLYHENEVCDDKFTFEELEKISQKEVYEILINNTKWPILYHFSPIRHNLLEWYDFKEDASLLEIGADCGAMTGMFCERVGKVVGIDTSYKRLKINALRNFKYDNLQLVACELHDYNSVEKYDYITMIGSFEYADYLFSANQADVKWMERLRNMLKQDGKVIIALRNKYALKYWAGASDDYSGKLYGNFYNSENTKAKSYSLEMIKDILEKAGYKKSYIYYPVPDYRMPNEIFSDDHLPKAGQIHGMRNNFDYERYDFFNEDTMMDVICKDNKFPQFANSYLIICEN